jgi:hypothetical protein
MTKNGTRRRFGGKKLLLTLIDGRLKHMKKRVGETMSSREGKAEAARPPPGSSRSRSQQDCRSRGRGPGRERRGNYEYKSMFSENLC